MAQAKIPATRKKKIRTVLSMMNKQNRRFIPVASPLVEMMDLTTTDAELDFLLKMGTGLYDFDQGLTASKMTKEQFEPFFDTMKRKGLVYIEYPENGREVYRLNAIAMGWYEAMMHYLVGKPEEKLFSEKLNEFFLFFRKFNLPIIRNAQNLALRPFLAPTQKTAIMDPAATRKSKRKTIPINTSVSPPETNVLPTFDVNDLIETYGDKDAICVFPCVCRHGNSLIGSPCDHKMPKESCIAFGDMALAYAGWGYGRKISKAEAVDILKEVRDKGAVHSVIYERDDCRLPALAICNCCWDCCGLLKPYNMGGVALKYNTAYTARLKEEINCKGCGNCEKFCPTTAMRLKDKKVTFNSDKCIGCGQCAYQCRQNNIELVPNERTVFLPVLKKSEIRVTA